MNILIVSMHFYPEDFRINDIASELARRGHAVSVLTGIPNYPEGEIYPGYEDKLYEEHDGVKIYRTKIRPRHKGTLNLFRNYMSFVRRGKKTVKRIKDKIDVVVSYETSPVYQIIPAIAAKKHFGCKLVCLCWDQWPASLSAGGISGGIVYRVVGYQSRKIYGKCDFILNSSPSFIEYNHKVNKIPLERMAYRQQHCPDAFSGISTSKENGASTTDLLFAGNIGKVQNVEDIIRAYNELRYDDLNIHIVGDGSEYDNCVKLVKELGIEKNVIMYGRVPASGIAEYYRKCDACLLTLSGKSAVGNTIPAKLQGYMCAGKTVLAAVGGDARVIMDEAGCGEYTDPDDYHKLASLIDGYYKDRDKYASCGAKGREYYEKNCTLEVFTDYLEELLSEYTETDK